MKDLTKNQWAVIYSIELPTGKEYIGGTINLSARMRAHKSIAKNKNHPSHYNPLYVAIRECGGWDNIKVKRLSRCKVRNMDKREAKDIKERKSIYPDGYNLNAGWINPVERVFVTGRIRVMKISEAAKLNQHMKELKKVIRAQSREVIMRSKGIWILDILRADPDVSSKSALAKKLQIPAPTMYKQIRRYNIGKEVKQILTHRKKPPRTAVSDATRLKASISMKAHWAKLSDADRAEKITNIHRRGQNGQGDQ